MTISKVLLASGQAMLKMRAIYLSGNFETCWCFHIEAEQRVTVEKK